MLLVVFPHLHNYEIHYSSLGIENTACTLKLVSVPSYFLEFTKGMLFFYFYVDFFILEK